MNKILDQARQQGQVVLPRSAFSGDQSKELTVLAEQQGLVVFKETDTKTKQSFIVVTFSRDVPCDPRSLSPSQLKAFSSFCNVYFDNPSTLQEDMVMYDVDPSTLSCFVEEIRKYGVDGWERRNTILEQEMVAELQKQPEYRMFQSTPPKRVAQLDSPMTITRKVYVHSNSHKFFFSIDLKAAVFNCYKQLNIIKTNTWKEFVSKFTPSISFANNKPSRLRVFGNLDKNGTNTILWNNALWKVWEQILEHWPEAEKKRVAIAGDEIILATTQEEIVTDTQYLLEKCGLDLDKLNIQCYCLISHSIVAPNLNKEGEMKTEKFFIRQKMDIISGKPNGQYDLKCIPKQHKKQAMLDVKEKLGL